MLTEDSKPLRRACPPFTEDSKRLRQGTTLSTFAPQGLAKVPLVRCLEDPDQKSLSSNASEVHTEILRSPPGMESIRKDQDKGSAGDVLVVAVTWIPGQADIYLDM